MATKRSQGKMELQMPGIGEALRLAQEKIEDRYFALDSVTGVGIGSKITAGHLSSSPCITVFVRTKLPLEELRPRERIPNVVTVKDSLSGKRVSIPTDVVQTGPITSDSIVAIPGPPETLESVPSSALTLNPGDPSAHLNLGGYGTLGCFLTDGTRQYALSNNHVYANENQAAIGDAIVYGSGDGNADDRFASLHAFEPLKPSTPNVVDAASAQIDDGAPTDPGIPKIGIPLGAAVATRNTLIRKYGARTGYTTGHVFSVNSTIKVRYDSFVAPFRSVIATRGAEGPFSKRGDSGSVYVASGKAVVGHHFAGASDDSVSFGSQICAVLDWAGMRVVADARPADTTLLYRYYLPNPLVDHLYSLDPCRESAGFGSSYTYEGLACRVYTKRIAGSVPLYRKYHPGAYDHLYTTARNEAPHYTHEGAVGFILRNQNPGTLPLYRMYNRYEPNGVPRHDHWLTTSAQERDNAVGSLGHKYEGVLGYVLPS